MALAQVRCSAKTDNQLMPTARNLAERQHLCQVATQLLSRLDTEQRGRLPAPLNEPIAYTHELSDDFLATFVVWSQMPKGHAVCEEFGEDPDLFPSPFPAIIAYLETDLLLHISPDGMGAHEEVKDFLSRQASIAPSLLRVLSPEREIDHLRFLVSTFGAFATKKAIAYLREVVREPAPSIATTLSLSPDGDLLVYADARSALLTSLREKTQPVWVDRERCWLIQKSEISIASEVLSASGLSIPQPVKDAARATSAPLLAMGDLDDLRDIALTRLKGMGERRAMKLQKVGISSIYDLLFYVPRRYLDRSRLTNIGQAVVGEEAALVGNITSIQPNIQRRIVKFSVSDGSGAISATFFNALWQAKRFKIGEQVILLGKIDEWRGRSRVERQMTNPIMESFSNETHLVVPVYPQSAKNGVSTWEIRKATDEALSRIDVLNDPLPASILTRLDLPHRAQSLKDVHFPKTLEAAEAARDRLAFDEFLRLQLALLRARLTMEKEAAVPQNPTGELTSNLISSLPFPLTGAQSRTWREIEKDISSSTPMHRLVQGDVGSGKTLIALLALLAAVEGGNQGALMAPTEILATQLYLEVCSRLDEAGLGETVRVALLTSKTKARERRDILKDVKDGSLNILVGTHSLIGAEVEFRSLGVVVIDEQHRFGVEQRAALRAKVGDNGAPDMLVMTATPIPRTAAITAFGDLDVSVIDELPPGRTPIETFWVQASPDLDSSSSNPWDDVLSEIRQGRQAFVVCPLVEGSERMQAASATETFEMLAAGALNGLRLLLVHGQQKSEERASAMAAFAAGEADILVSTTVIEVGVNVPNATRMVILNADRFGIAQLHQLRGRVGRGNHPSRCYLIAEPTSSEGQQRLQALCDSTDGFYLSEVDLSLRGAGNILGSEQSGGVSDFRVADIMRDRRLLEEARVAALELLDDDPSLSAYPLLRRELLHAVGEEQAEWLFKS